MLWLRVQILILCCTSLTVDAQTYIAKMEHFGIHEGLSNQYVTSMVQDTDGILWIGTKDGLNRFDGFKFTEFNTQNSKLRSGSITYMHLGPDGHLYVYTSNASTPAQASDVQYIDLATQTFHDADTTLARFIHSNPFRFLYYTRGTLYGGKRPGMYSFADKKIYPFNLPEGFEWDGRFLHYATEISKDTIRIVDLFHPEQIINPATTDDPFARYFWNNKDSYRNYFGGSAIYFDAMRQIVWTNQHQLTGARLNGQLAAFANDSTELQFPRRVTNIIGSDRLFVGTEAGFFIVSLEEVKFRNYFIPRDLGGEMDKSETRGILVYQDTLYACVDGGVYRSPVADPQDVTRSAEISRPRVIQQMDPQHFLIGGIEIFKFQPVYHRLQKIVEYLGSDASAWSMFRYHDNLYISNTHGIAEVPFRPDSMQVFDRTYLQLPGRNHAIVYYFVPVGKDRLILVSSAGLMMTDENLSLIRPIRFAKQDGSAALFRHFTYLLQTGQDEFWTTSLDGGLVEFTLKDSIATIRNQLNRDDGVPTNAFYAVCSDSLGSFWASTELGIVQLDTADWSFQIYSRLDGIKNEEFNRISFCRDAQGDIYFGGLQGVTAFNPRDFYSKTMFPLHLSVLNVEQYSGWESRVINSTAAFRATHQVRLGPGDNFFVLDIGLNDLFLTRQHHYQYRVKDMHPEWLDLQGNRLRIHGLPYGEHLLEIRGKNAHGVSAKNTLHIPILVIRPIYLRWWFLLGIGLGIFMIIREYWVARTRRMQLQAQRLETLVSERTARIAEQAKALQQMAEARSRFFANISHELRTPLTLIKGPVKSLMSGDKSQEEEYLKMIDYNAHLLAERIEDLLTLARADSGNLVVRKTAVKVNPFLERIIDSFRGLADERHFDLVLENTLPANAVVLTDTRKMEHILSNFLSNALKYANPDTQIVLRCRRDDDQLVVSVSDEGPGIAPDLLERIFERFYKGDSLQGGVGIGLALSRELAEVMHGSIWVESEVGQGSTFYISIPYEPADDIMPLEPVVSVPSQPLLQNPGHPGRIHAPKILCVEDNGAMRAYLATELQAYQVTTCENGVQALDRLNEMLRNASLPDCVLSDVMMPEMDGFELVRKIRATPRLSAIPIILLTARAGHDDKLTGLRIGVDDYITKPFDADELRIRINNLVGRKPMKQEAISEDGEQVTSIDDKWLRSVEAQMAARLHERDFTIDQLAIDLHMSRSQLYRRIKAYTGLTPHSYLREARLFKAKEILEAGEAATIAQLSAAVGFEDPGYFSRIYTERFGYRPSEKL